MTRTWMLSSATVSLVLALLASPALARTVMIETRAPLGDHSDPAVHQAFQQVIEATVKGAKAMGLGWIWLHDARVLRNAILVQMIATDEDPRSGTAPGEEPGNGGQQPGDDTSPGTQGDQGNQPGQDQPVRAPRAGLRL